MEHEICYMVLQSIMVLFFGSNFPIFFLTVYSMWNYEKDEFEVVAKFSESELYSRRM
jgi:hypothetical protein